jgi:hypothetical protein
MLLQLVGAGIVLDDDLYAVCYAGGLHHIGNSAHIVLDPER